MNIEFIKKAIEAGKSADNEIPVGAVIVKNNEIVAIAHNRKEELKDITAHAEILAIRAAEQKLDNWRLNGCDLYVTLEPCPMCMWAILQSRLDNVYFGSYDTLYGSTTCLPEMTKIANSKTKIRGGIMEEECDRLLNKYFESIR